jgi:hypothetical protein
MVVSKCINSNKINEEREGAIKPIDSIYMRRKFLEG